MEVDPDTQTRDAVKLNSNQPTGRFCGGGSRQSAFLVEGCPSGRPHSNRPIIDFDLNYR